MRGFLEEAGSLVEMRSRCLNVANVQTGRSQRQVGAEEERGVADAACCFGRTSRLPYAPALVWQVRSACDSGLEEKA